MLQLKKTNIITFINLILFIRGLIYFTFKFKFKYKQYPMPPSNIIDIGCFDRKLLIQVKDKYRNYFEKKSINACKSNDRLYKMDTIRLVLINNSVYIKKTFKGSLKKRTKFYNEIECLNKMENLKNVPKLKYIDFDNLIIYIQYIEGDCLQRITETNRSYSNAVSKILKCHLKDVLKKIHNYDIVVIDVWSHNIIYNNIEKDAYFIDFEDSICTKLIPKRILERLKREDEIKLVEKVLSKL